MKNTFRRILSILMATAMCFAMSTSTFAEEVTPVVESTEAMSDEVMPRGSISGYASKLITTTDKVIYVPCTSSGGLFGSGMGITIKTTSSTGNSYLVGFQGGATSGSASFISGTIYTSAEKQFSNLSHNGCSQYMIAFEVPAYCDPFTVQVWIYG